MDWTRYWSDRLKHEINARNYSSETLKNYDHVLRAFLAHRPGDPRTWSRKDIQTYLLDLRLNKELAASTVNLHREALRFFRRHLTGSEGCMARIPRLKENQALPDVLDSGHVGEFLSSLKNPKHRLALSLAYCCGLRVAELAKLKKADFDFERKTIHIRQGKGRKDRLTLLPESLVEPLKNYLDCHKPSTYLFESRDADTPMTKRSFQAIFKRTCNRTGLKMKGGIHSLRHAFATHLLENGTDLKIIQSLLGHSQLKTTERYVRVSRKLITKVKSPIDGLAVSNRDRKFVLDAATTT